MRELFEFGQRPNDITLMLAAQFLHDELPIRLAQRVRQLRDMPMGLSNVGSIREVRKMYEHSFKLIKSIPKPRSKDQEQDFTTLIHDIKEKHRHLQLHVAEGLQELCTTSPEAIKFDFSSSLDAFYSNRIGIRLLIGQHVALHTPRDGYVGVIKTHCRMMDCCQMAVTAASELCSHYYGQAPEVQYHGDLEMTFTYIPAHVYYILFELIKNSMRATVEAHGEDDILPPINIVIAEGKRDVCVKISDVGGGIPREGIERIWSYTYTTAKRATATSVSPMAGFGHGLPFSRLYARYFGGNVDIMSMEGYGTDAYVHLNKIGDVVYESPID